MRIWHFKLRNIRRYAAYLGHWCYRYSNFKCKIFQKKFFKKRKLLKLNEFPENLRCSNINGAMHKLWYYWKYLLLQWLHFLYQLCSLDLYKLLSGISSFLLHELYKNKSAKKRGYVCLGCNGILPALTFCLNFN